MPDITLRRHLSETNLPLNIALRGVVDAGETDIKSVKLSYSFDDDADMKPQVAGTVAPGAALAFPIDLNNRPIRISAVGYTEDGRSHVTDLKEATQAVYTPTVFDKTVKTGLFSLFNFAFRGQISDPTDEIANDGAGRYYNYLMPHGTFGDGESLMLIYTWNSFGVLATREHKPTFGDIQMGGLSTSDEGYGVTQILLQRHGSSIWATPSFLSDMVGSDDVGVEPVEITTIDPDTEDIEIKYVGTYTGGFGEFYVLSGVGYKIPAPATSTVVYLTEDGTGEILFADGGLEALTEG
jgi:hypothetical protein